MPRADRAATESTGHDGLTANSSQLRTKRDFSLRRPTRSQEANVKEKASACCVRNDGVGSGVQRERELTAHSGRQNAGAANYVFGKAGRPTCGGAAIHGAEGNGYLICWSADNA